MTHGCCCYCERGEPPVDSTIGDVIAVLITDTSDSAAGTKVGEEAFKNEYLRLNIFIHFPHNVILPETKFIFTRDTFCVRLSTNVHENLF